MRKLHAPKRRRSSGKRHASGRRATPTFLFLAFSAGALVAGSQQIYAQLNEEDDDGLGIRSGGVIFSPTFTSSVNYDSNVYSAKNNKTDDAFFRIEPRLDIDVDGGLTSFNLNGGADIILYADQTSEDQNNGDVSLQFRYGTPQTAAIGLDASFVAAHESRSSPDSPAAAVEPVAYQTYQVSPSLHRQFNRVGATLTGRFEYNHFQDVDLADGGVSDQSYRDRIILGGSLRTSYDFADGTAIFVEGSYNHRNRKDSHLSTPSRDSQGFEINGGFDFEISRLLIGEIYGGYIRQDFKESSFKDIATYGVGASLQWQPSPGLLVDLDASRRVAGSALADVSSRIETGVSLDFDFAVFHGLTLSPLFSYRHEEFNGIDREDDVFTSDIDLTLDLNRHIFASLGYRYTERWSDLETAEYDRHMARFALTLAF